MISTATLGAGGLELTNADNIAMEREDLFISTEQVKVDYVFRNRSGKDETHVVAFPMPLIEPSFYMDSDISLADSEADNFLGFTISVDGRPVAPLLDMRAYAGDVDITDQLSAAGVPLNPLRQTTWKALHDLTPAVLQSLAGTGGVFAEDGMIEARWTLKATYYWEQAFPAGKPVKVSHSYEPGTGSWFYDPQMLQDREALDRFCIEDGAKVALERGGTKDGRSWVLAHNVRYILKTGANWAGPIGQFRLTVDKGQADAVISLCAEGIVKISPTRFEMRRMDFTPESDLDILMVTPMPKED